ncbi:MAG: NAD(+) diphosphatase [Treponema sp.]|nr:NAD(+) diphosphatase [Treponema sp.]
MVKKTFLFQEKTVFTPLDSLIAFKSGEEFIIPPLGNISSIRVIDIPSDIPPLTRESFMDVRTAVSLMKDEEAEAMFRAFHIVQWRRESVFCGRCGHKNIDLEQEVARICPNCGRVEFPRICPAIIVLITDDEDRILLAHNKKFKPEVFSLIAGFNEAGETLEETVAREVMEETSIRVKDIRYATSQMWPFPNSLMIGWIASYAGGIIHPDGVEIEEARWFNREQLPKLPAKGSVARKLIDQWRNGVHL